MPSRVKPPSRAKAPRLVDERALDQVAHVGEVVELRDQAAQQRRLHVGQHRPDARHRRQRLAQRDEIARARGAERGARHQPLEVVDRLERLAELAAIGRSERQLLDGVEPVADALERAERAQQPRAQQPAAP